VAPLGLADRPLPKGPFDYPTGEGQDIRVEVVTKALNSPYSMAFLPDGTLLIAERVGRLRIVRRGKLDPQPVPGGPASYWFGKPGLQGTIHGYQNLALHPQFASNHWIYLSYTKPLSATERRVAVARATWSPAGLTEVKDIWVGDAATGGSTPIVFGRDGMLYIATSGGDAQSPASTGGKVLRVKDDGSAPADNPFVGKPGYLPEIYTLGHRNSLGLAVHPATGEVWQSENGPNGGDELNVLQAGKNYGWPIVSYGRQYSGPWQARIPTHEGYEPPIVYWTPAIAVAGFTFYTGDKLAKWKGDVFAGGMRTGEVPGTGKLERILFNEKMEELRRESLLAELHQRIRDVKQGPDGLIYVITDAGALLRISPR
jgi:glucose/arabinose dehydrogenase